MLIRALKRQLRSRIRIHSETLNHLIRSHDLSALVRVYHRHHPDFRALAGRLAATDHLIDRVVYPLYGLAAQEIAIFEGAS